MDNKKEEEKEMEMESILEKGDDFKGGEVHTKVRFWILKRVSIY